MEVSRKASFRTIWNDKNVTEDLSKYLSSVSYTDHEEGFSDEVSFTFDNSTGLFSEDWYPTAGTTIQLFIGYEDKQVDCGLFQVDEVVLTGLPDVAEIKAMAAGVTQALRTRNSKAFEALNLKQIAQFYCNKHGLELVDTSSMLSQINLDRKTQKDETDLSFLSNLAKEYGFIFSIKGKKLIFISYYDLDNQPSIKEIDKTEIGNYSLTEKTYDTYASSLISVKNPKKGKVVESTSNAELVSYAGDVFKVYGSAPNKQIAEAKAKAGLWNKNKFKQSGSLSNLEGDPDLVAGVNFDLTGVGLGSGKYHITTSTHTVTGNDSYTTSIEIRKTGTVPKPKRVPRTISPSPTVNETVNNDMQ